MNSSNLQIQGQNDTYNELRILNEANSQELRFFYEEMKEGEKKTTLQPYFQKKVSLTKLVAHSKEINSLLYRATHLPEMNGKGSEKKLQTIGLSLYNAIFPPEIKRKLAETDSRNLHVTIDDSLIGLPWELIHDGEEFFCLRFNMGRKVYTPQPVSKPKTQSNKKIKMLILADPERNLPDSYKEGKCLHRELYDWDNSLKVFFQTNDITTHQISRKIFDFDIIHYAGHVIYDSENPGMSGWSLEDSILTAQDIMQLAGCKKSLPLLIFSNACQSGQTSEWSGKGPEEYTDSQAFDLVNAFLRCGVLHYIGTFQDVRDLSSSCLALNFYQFIAKSYTIGEALRMARLKIMNEGNKYGKNNLIWAYYMLYGDPTISYLGQRQPEAVSERPKSQPTKYDHDKEEMPAIERQGQDLDLYTNQDISGAKYGLTRTGTAEGEKNTNSSPQEKGSKDQHNSTKNKIKEHQRPIPKKSHNLLWKTLLFFIFFIIVISGVFLLTYIFRSPEYDDIKYAADTTWEDKKWQIVQDILKKLKERYPDYPNMGKNLSNDKSPGSTNVVSNTLLKDLIPSPLTMCIIPAIPREIDQKKDNKITEQIIEGLIQFFAAQPNCTPVERERLDFVLKELEMATSELSQSKLEFALGRIFGTKAILFVRVFRQNGRFQLPFFTQETDVYIRYVDTQTSAIKAGVEISFKDEKINQISKRLGEKILIALNKS